MIYLLIVLPISESIRLPVHVQLVSLLQWHLPSMRWPIYSHRSTYQWIDSPTSSRATSESASMTSILNAMAYSLSSFYPPVNLTIRSRATSEPATMASPKSISSMSKSISEPASMASVNSWPLRWASRFSSSEPASMAPANSRSLRWASRFLPT